METHCLAGFSFFSHFFLQRSSNFVPVSQQILTVISFLCYKTLSEVKSVDKKVWQKLWNDLRHAASETFLGWAFIIYPDDSPSKKRLASFLEVHIKQAKDEMLADINK
jgi:hypothetical protein